MALEIAIDPSLSGRARLGILVLDGVTVREGDPALVAEVDGYCARLRERHGGGPSGEIEGATEARALYKALGLDPTKTRPSNEALARRALKGEPLYRINTLVDALNLCSLRAQLPFGLYDLDRVEGAIVLRKGHAGESYEGIRKGPVNVDGRPTLADSRGAFGNPTSDSARTSITLDAKRALVTVYAPAAFGNARLGAVLDDTQATLTRFCGGAAAERRLL
jgi:DNA/RNA-binding domain of Phe-tRNA-synthetase-like protein